MRLFNLAALLATFLLAGCVTGTRSLDNLEIPEYSAGESANGNVYIATIVDKREFEQKPASPSTPSVKGTLSKLTPEELSTLIGRQRNGYGKAMGDVALPEGVTVHDAVRDILTTGLESRGYQVVDDPNAANQMSIDINKFWAWFSPGFWAVSFESNLDCAIEFSKSGSPITFDVAGYGINKGQVASNANWELAFKRAFEDFLKNLDQVMDEKGL